MSPVLASAATTAAVTTQSVVFWLLAVVSVGAACGMVLARRAVHCAIFLAAVMLSLAVFYAMQGAPFLAFVQVIVYTGAVLMLFLFVMMLIGVSSADSLVETIRGQRLAAAVAGIGLVVLLLLGIGHTVIGPAQPMTSIGGQGNLSGIATLIFTTYVFPFEVTSALLITAALGAMVLAHRERTSPKLTQRELSRRRIASKWPTPLPSPGVYALHNAVDMPALLPDGTPSELSVSPVLTRRELGTETAPVPESLPAGGDEPPRGGEQGNGEPGGGQPGGAQPSSGGPDNGQPGDAGTERPVETSTQGRSDS
ncbi:MAG TPA: NADH-quinone oxidoreductase subunit J [Streptosporangiaceae bacterium]|nr:NADH-quinone oxidoreductase subunit J [Streptosporangiaceae bacterium]